MRKIVAPIMFVALATTGLTVAGSTAAHADGIPTTRNVTYTYESDATSSNISGMYDSPADWNPFSPATNSIGTPSVSHAGKAILVTRGNQDWSGFNVFSEAGNVFDSANKSVTFDVYNAQSSDRQILVKAEGNGAVQTFVTAVPGWSTVTATLPSVPDAGYPQLDFFPGFVGQGTVALYGASGETYAFDNVVVPFQIPASTTFTYESDATSSNISGMYDSPADWNPYSPATNSIGTPSVSHAGKAILVTRGNQDWSGFNVFSEAGNVFDSANKSVTFDVYNAQSSDRQILVKAEGNGAVQTFVTAVPGWSTVTATLPSVPDAGYPQLDFFPGFVGQGTVALYGASGETYAFDNVVVPWTHAVAAPEASASPTPTVASIKLDDADLGAVYAIGNSWWGGEGSGSRNVVKYISAGATTSLHYTVLDTAGNPVNGAQVTLATSGTADGATSGDRTKTTGSDGKVTFTFVNSTANADAEWPRPSYTVWSDRAAGPEVAFDAIPYISGSSRHTQCYDAGNATTCNRDRVWGRVVSTATYTAPVTANARLLLGDTKAMSNKSYWYTDNAKNVSWVKFLTAGNKLTLRYRVDVAGTPVGAGVEISLVDDGNVGGASFAEATPKATTDANGYATFVVTNTNTSGENRPVAPSTINYWDDSRNPGSEVLQKWNVAITGNKPAGVATTYYDRIWAHIISKPSSQGVPNAPYLVSAKRSGSKNLTVSWTAATEDGNANTGYEVVLSPTATAVPTITATAAATASSLSIAVPGTASYAVSVKAKNSEGKSAATSASMRIAASSTTGAVGTTLLAPTMGTPIRGVDALWIPFTPSTTDKGATAFYYEYSKDNGSTWQPATYDSAATEAGKVGALFMFNLPNSTTFNVKMRAVNALGAGAGSTTAKTVATATKANPPTVTGAKYNDGKVTITYTNVTSANANDGGTPVTGYQYTLNGGASWVTLSSAQKAANKVEISLTDTLALNVQMRSLNGLDGNASPVIAIKAPELPSATVLAGTGKVTVKVVKYSALKLNNSSITKLQYSKDAGVTWTNVTWDGVADKSFDIAAVKGTSITAKVRTVNSAGTSSEYTLPAATTK